MSESKGSGCARVLLVDDHPLYRDALRAWLSREPDFGVCGEAGNAADARRLCDELQPDLILLDLALPDEDGLALLQESRGWAKPPKVLVVTVRGDDDPAAVEAMRLGAAGFVSKQVSGEELLRIVRQVCGGQNYLSPGLVDQLLRRRGG